MHHNDIAKLALTEESQNKSRSKWTEDFSRILDRIHPTPELRQKLIDQISAEFSDEIVEKSLIILFEEGLSEDKKQIPISKGKIIPWNKLTYLRERSKWQKISDQQSLHQTYWIYSRHRAKNKNFK